MPVLKCIPGYVSDGVHLDSKDDAICEASSECKFEKIVQDIECEQLPISEAISECKSEKNIQDIKYEQSSDIDASSECISAVSNLEFHTKRLSPVIMSCVGKNSKFDHNISSSNRESSMRCYRWVTSHFVDEHLSYNDFCKYINPCRFSLEKNCSVSNLQGSDSKRKHDSSSEESIVFQNTDSCNGESDCETFRCHSVMDDRSISDSVTSTSEDSEEIRNFQKNSTSNLQCNKSKKKYDSSSEESIVFQNTDSFNGESDCETFRHSVADDTSISDRGTSTSEDSEEIMSFQKNSIPENFVSEVLKSTLAWVHTTFPFSEEDLDSSFNPTKAYDYPITEEDCNRKDFDSTCRGSLKCLDLEFPEELLPSSPEDSFEVLSEISCSLVSLNSDRYVGSCLAPQASENPYSGDNSLLSPLRIANEKWEKNMLGVTDLHKEDGKVQFAPESRLVEVRYFQQDPEELVPDTYALDQAHFRRRIYNFSLLMSPFLTSEHQAEILRRNSFV